MKKQNDVSMFLAGKVISTLARNSNLVFSPASVNAVLTMEAATSQSDSVKKEIMTFLKSASIDELNADLLVNFFKAEYAQVDFRSKWLVGLRRRLCLRAVEQTTDSASQSSGSLKFVSIVERCSFDGGSIHRDGGSPGDDCSDFGAPLRWLSFEGTPVAAPPPSSSFPHLL
ncbi:hypothetical protein YC2023_114775 [Brassica napus]